MPSSFSRTVARIGTSLTFLAEEYSVAWTCHLLRSHLSVDGHFGCFYSSALVSNAAIDTSLCANTCFRVSWANTPPRELADSQGNHGRNCQTVFHSGYGMSRPRRAAREGSRFSSSSSTLTVTSPLDFSPSRGFEVPTSSGSGSRFPNDY